MCARLNAVEREVQRLAQPRAPDPGRLNSSSMFKPRWSVRFGTSAIGSPPRVRSHMGMPFLSVYSIPRFRAGVKGAIAPQTPTIFPVKSQEMSNFHNNFRQFSQFTMVNASDLTFFYAFDILSSEKEKHRRGGSAMDKRYSVHPEHFC